MGSRAYSGIVKRAKKPKYTPLVTGNFNKKFAEFAAKKGLHHGKMKNPGFAPGAKNKKAA